MEQHKITVDELPKHCCPLPLPENEPHHVLTVDEMPKYVICPICAHAEEKQ